MRSTKRAEPAPVAERAVPVRRTLVLTSAQGKPSQDEIRRAIAADAAPDAVSVDDGIGATILDERYIAAATGLRGRLLRRLPFLLAQAVEVFLHANDYDAIVTWGERHSLMVAVVLGLRRRRPGHVAILVWPSKRNRPLMRFVLRDVDRFIVYSPLQRLYAESRLGFPRDRFVNARYSVDTHFWRPMDGPGDLICSAGAEMRDYPTLLQALAPVDIPCHIATGQGLFQARYLQEQSQGSFDGEEIPANVSLGRKSLLELRELYARSRFVVIPLIPSDQDNGITAILEAMAMGKAVIATENPGNTRVLEHGVSGLIVPPYDPVALRDAITKLWQDPDLCAVLGRAARQAVVEQNALAQWGAGLGQAVDEAAAARRPSR
jgi:glycosyltransferase involved in cell wall biosynthesis